MVFSHAGELQVVGLIVRGRRSVCSCVVFSKEVVVCVLCRDAVCQGCGSCSTVWLRAHRFDSRGARSWVSQAGTCCEGLCDIHYQRSCITMQVGIFPATGVTSQQLSCVLATPPPPPLAYFITMPSSASACVSLQSISPSLWCRKVGVCLAPQTAPLSCVVCCLMWLVVHATNAQFFLLHTAYSGGELTQCQALSWLGSSRWGC
jgi:hypothetical protein